MNLMKVFMLEHVHSAEGVFKFHDGIVTVDRFMKDILRRYVYGPGGTFPQLDTKTWRKLLPDSLVLLFLFISANADSDFVLDSTFNVLMKAIAERGRYESNFFLGLMIQLIYSLA